MKLGIMSDSHGSVNQVRAALEVLRAAGAEALIHCGDVGGIEVLEELADWRCWFVWGNTDQPDPAWRAELESLGFSWPEGILQFEIEGKRMVVCHGHERGAKRIQDQGDWDYFFFGHTHIVEDRQVDSGRLINPGALHRARVPTVATLDLATDTLEILPVRPD
jgi:hypothetical protein